MHLSDEQMTAVTGPGVGAWEEVARPVGPQPLPEWVKGAAADWGYGYANPPSVTLKVAGNVHTWPDQRWVKEGTKTYIARHPDGRALVHYHNGAVSRGTAWRLVDPTPPATRPVGQPVLFRSVADVQAGITDPWPREIREAHAAWKVWRLADADAAAEGEKQLQWLRGRGLFSDAARVETKPVLQTTKQAGYGGREYFITMQDGTDLALRGPWHGGAPTGYVEAHTHDATKVDPFWAKRGTPWHRYGCCYGLYITEELWLRIVARYIPHALVLRVHHSYGVRLELSQAGWNGPKAQAYRAEQQRAINKQPASPNWRLFWDGRGGYSGSLRTPTYGFEPGVDPTPPRRFWE